MIDFDGGNAAGRSSKVRYGTREVVDDAGRKRQIAA
jgi:hypothetical protein